MPGAISNAFQRVGWHMPVIPTLLEWRPEEQELKSRPFWAVWELTQPQFRETLPINKKQINIAEEVGVYKTEDNSKEAGLFRHNRAVHTQRGQPHAGNPHKLEPAKSPPA